MKSTARHMPRGDAVRDARRERKGEVRHGDRNRKRGAARKIEGEREIDEGKAAADGKGEEKDQLENLQTITVSLDDGRKVVRQQ